MIKPWIRSTHFLSVYGFVQSVSSSKLVFHQAPGIVGAKLVFHQAPGIVAAKLVYAAAKVSDLQMFDWNFFLVKPGCCKSYSLITEQQPVLNVFSEEMILIFVPWTDRVVQSSSIYYFYTSSYKVKRLNSKKVALDCCFWGKCREQVDHWGHSTHEDKVHYC